VVRVPGNHQSRHSAQETIYCPQLPCPQLPNDELGYLRGFSPHYRGFGKKVGYHKNELFFELRRVL
jgi:hypothetical protein